MMGGMENSCSAKGRMRGMWPGVWAAGSARAVTMVALSSFEEQ